MGRRVGRGALTALAVLALGLGAPSGAPGLLLLWRPSRVHPRLPVALCTHPRLFIQLLFMLPCWLRVQLINFQCTVSPFLVCGCLQKLPATFAQRKTCSVLMIYTE